MLEKAGLFPIHIYLDRRRRYLDKYAATSPLIDVCRALKLQGGLSDSNRRLWWTRTALDVDQNGPSTPQRTPSPALTAVPALDDVV